MPDVSKKMVSDVEVRGRRALMRADFNVPLDGAGVITDVRRIEQCLPTIREIIQRGGRCILMSHLGRPKGEPDAKYSLRPVAQRLKELLSRPVAFAEDCIGLLADEAVGRLRDGEVLLLENLRFHLGETIIDKAAKNPDGKLTPEQDQQRREFAAALAAHADIYVNNAFGTCHRNHVSMYDVPRLLPKGSRVLGHLVERELEFLGEAVRSPKRPFVAILGGAKVSDKIGVIRSLLRDVDAILIGGAMTYTFWAAQGMSVGKSLCERDKVDLARSLLREGGDKIELPVDSVAAAELKAGVATRTITGELPADLMGLDVGPRTLELYSKRLLNAKTIVWNGPVGAFETEPFDKGTFAVARMLANATRDGATSIIGGGDSAAAIEKAGLADAVSHISTGGGASLEFLEKRRFDTIDVLDDVEA
jgi:phosphoglycerate kinase